MITVPPAPILLLAYWTDGTLNSLSDADLEDLGLTRPQAEALLREVLVSDTDHLGSDSE